MKLPRLACLLPLLPALAVAQSPPLHRPLNPTAASRSGLAYQPYVPYDLTRHRWSASVEYGSAIELEQRPEAFYLLDAELMRTSVGYTRDLSPRLWISGQGEVVGSYAGFADGFFDWYHRQIGYREQEREARPKNQYAYEIDLPDGTHVTPARAPMALGDTRVTLGWRHNPDQQTAFAITLPTATGQGNFGRGVPSLSVTHTLHVDRLAPVYWEVSTGAGFTPRHGALGPYERTLFGMGTTGVRIHLWGGQSIYGYFFYHTPYYHGTTLPSLDNHELTADFGWMVHSRSGNEWRIGLGEDLAPGDAGIDLILKLSGSW